MLLDLRKFNLTGKELEHRLDEVGITANKNTIPDDPQSPFVTSGLRIGTPAVTSRGMKEDDMIKIAELIRMTAAEYETAQDAIRAGVKELCDKHKLY